MKKEFSKNWKASKQPRKQRKYRANAPLHLKRKMINITFVVFISTVVLLYFKTFIETETIIPLTILGLFFLTLYVFLLFIFKAFDKNDIMIAKSLMKKLKTC